jgi:hypothetical protein
LGRNNEDDSIAKMKAAEEALEAKETVMFSLVFGFFDYSKIIVVFVLLLVICTDI